MQNHIRVLTITFDKEISSYEVPLFRGAVISTIGKEADVLYHNHTDVGYRNSYPLIQYKRIGRKPTIVCINEGADIIGQYMQMFTGKLLIGDKTIETSIQSIIPQRVLTQIWQSEFKYRIFRWLPLNSKNYARYNATESYIERVVILQEILKGNILSMLKGLGIYLESELKVEINYLSDSFTVINKGIKMLSLNADFTTNVSLPNNIGLGKNVSFGFGRIREITSPTDIEK